VNMARAGRGWTLVALVAGSVLCLPAGAQEDVAAGFRAQRVELLKQALGAAQEAGLDVLEQRITDQIAEASLKAGDLDAARAAYTDIVNRSEERREQLAFDPALRQQWFADNIGPYRKLLRVVALQEDPAMALSVAERMRSRALQDQLSWQKVDLGLRLSPADQDRLAELRGLREQAYGQLQWALGGGKPEVETAATGEDKRGKYMPIRGSYMPVRGSYMPIRGPLDNSPAATSEDIAALKGTLTKLAQEETALEGAIRESVPAYAEACNTAIPSGEELIAEVAKHPDLAVLEYTLCDDGVVVVALGPGGEPQVEHIALSADKLWEQIGSLRQAIWERKPEALDLGAHLYSTLVNPVESTLAGARRLWVIADSALQLVPFSALVCSDKVFLGYYAAVATAPSLSLALSSRGERPKAGKSALILAAPDTGAVEADATAEGDRGKYMPIRGMYMPVRGSYMPIRGDGGVSSALTAMATVPLPGARAEGEALAGGITGAELLSGKEATKARLLADGGDCDILHVATHGYADPDYPDFSGVLLAGTGPEAPYDTLTAHEVYLWPLRARLVTLSACQTALGKDMEGEGVLGLTRAFIYAGAQDVLCSLWPVADESTKALMTDLYAALAQGATVEDALHTAQISLMTKQATNAPFYWAAFQAVRGPG
jgi:CHAT domain-containing protein